MAAAHARGLTLGAHGFALLGVLLGLSVLSSDVGLSFALNFDLHYLMLAGPAVVFALALVPGGRP